MNCSGSDVIMKTDGLQDLFRAVSVFLMPEEQLHAKTRSGHTVYTVYVMICTFE